MCRKYRNLADNRNKQTTQFRYSVTKKSFKLFYC